MADAGVMDATDLFKDLEEQFNKDGACNLNHDILLVDLPCTIKIVSIGTACQAQARLCAVATGIIINYMQNGGRCPWCQRPATECWKIVPA